MDRSKNTELDEKLEALATEAKNKFALARKGSEESLLNYKAVGEVLIEAKALRPKGYLAWAKEHLDIGKQWCANLVFLATNWPEYEQARSWAEEKGEILGRKEYGVDGAVALVKRYRKETNPATQKGEDSPKRASKTSMLEAKVESLERLVADLMAQNAGLMRELAGDVVRSMPAKPMPLDVQIRDKAQKVSRLWHSGFYGEPGAAENILREMAQSRGWEFDAFLRECGIERPVDWTSAEAA
jgi:hypothetical protein